MSQYEIPRTPLDPDRFFEHQKHNLKPKSSDEGIHNASAADKDRKASHHHTDNSGYHPHQHKSCL
jgi:hypothetical protein